MPSNDGARNEPNASQEEEEDIIPIVLNGAPFKIRSDNEKIQILQKGRPLPKLGIVKRDIGSNCNRTFLPSWYGIHKWLCGSKNYNKLFCWPCVLMRPETSSWCSTGNDDMKRFTSLATKHAVCKSHLKAVTEYDATLIGFSLSPEFVSDSEFKCKEEANGDTSDHSEESFALYFQEIKNKKPTTNYDTENDLMAVAETAETNTKPEMPKSKTKITFRSWQEMNKDTFPLSRLKHVEDMKLYKWKRKIAKQELKNGRLLGEKLKFEIAALKAKEEYYKSVKADALKEQVSPSQTSVTVHLKETGN